MNSKYRYSLCCLLFICVCVVTYLSKFIAVKHTYHSGLNNVDRLNVLPMILGQTKSSNILKNISNAMVTKQQLSMENNLTCSAKKVKESLHSLPITGLVSFPGSGNTWSRHLIQQMSGLGTSSCYCDGSLRVKGFPFECHRDKSKTLVVKTHEFQHVLQYKFKKMVLLIRNPYDALLAYASFAKAGHTGKPSKPVLIQASKQMFNHSLKWYVNLTNRTIEGFSGPVHILQYEKLKTDMSDTLWKLASFLNVNVTRMDIDCTVKLQEGNFHRNTSEDEHLRLLNEVYSKDQLLQMREAAEQSEKLLKTAYGLDFDVGSPIERLLFDDIS